MTINGCTVCGRSRFGKEGHLLRRIGYGWLLCMGGQHRDVGVKNDPISERR
jgi:hypothetical protein